MYTTQDVKRVQERLLEMAIKIRNVLEANDIPYILAFGTLLGAVRHKGFIPWDDDFDLHLFEDSYEQGLAALRKDLPEDMFVEYFDSEPKYFHAWAHVKDKNSVVYSELFPHDNLYQHKGISIDLYRLKRMKEEEEDLYRTEEYIKYLDRRKKYDFVDPAYYAEKMVKLQPAYLEAKKKVESFNGESREIYASLCNSCVRLYPEEVFPLKKYEFEGELFYGLNNADVYLRTCYHDYLQLPPVENRKPHFSSVEFLEKKQ